MPKFPEITLVAALGSAAAENKVNVNTRTLLALEEACVVSPTSRSPLERQMVKWTRAQTEATLSG